MAAAVVDAGPLYAAANLGDADHERSLGALARSDLELVIPALVLGEATYMVATRLGPRAEALFLRGLESFAIEVPRPEEWARIGDLVDEYADFPLGGADASVVALAERLNTPIVITLDRRHFSAVRPRHCEALQLLPE